MKLKVHLLTIAVLSLRWVSSFDNICTDTVTVEKQVFNLKSLDKEYLLKFNVTSKPTVMETQYKFNLCKPIEKEEGIEVSDQCSDSSLVCGRKTNYKSGKDSNGNLNLPRVVEVLDLAKGPEQPKWKLWNNKENKLEGLEWELSGEKYNQVQYSTNVQLKCFEKEVPPQFVQLTDGKLTLLFKTPNACIKGKDGENPSPTEPSGTPILTLVLVGLIFYFVVGVVYNYSVYNYSGVQLLPHASFWREVPNHFMEGLHWLGTRLGGRRRNQGYTSV